MHTIYLGEDPRKHLYGSREATRRKEGSHGYVSKERETGAHSHRDFWGSMKSIPQSCPTEEEDPWDIHPPIPICHWLRAAFRRALLGVSSDGNSKCLHQKALGVKGESHRIKVLIAFAVGIIQEGRRTLKKAWLKI